MSTNVGEIRARLMIETDRFERQLADARRRISDLETTSRRSAGGMRELSSAIAGVGAGVGLSKLVGDIMQAVNASTKLYNAFMGLNAVAKGFGVQTADAQAAAQSLADRGFLSLTQAVNAYKTALSTGLNLEESTNLINALADAAAYNRQSFYDMGGAIQASLDGIKNGNSTLTDAVGVTKNLSVMQAEYAKSIGTTAAKLTEAQKIQAAYNGFLSEASLYAGNADESMQSFAGTQARFTQATNEASVAMGEAFTPAVQNILEALTPAIKAVADFASENKELTAGLATGAVGILAAVTALSALAALIKTLPAIYRAATLAAEAFNVALGPIGWAIALIGGAAAAFGAFSAAKARDKEETQQLIAAQKELNDILGKAPVDRTAADVDSLKTKTEELNPVLEERAKLQERLNEIQSLADKGQGSPQLLSEAMDTNDEIAKLDKKLRSLGYTGVEQATQKLAEMNAYVKQGVIALTDQDKAEAQALATRKQTLKEMSAYATEFKKLNSAQDLDATQKNRLVDITEKLIEQYPELNAQQGEDGRIRADNIDQIIAQIDADKKYTDDAAANMAARIRNYGRETTAQAQAVQTQIDNLTRLSNALAVMSGTKASSFSDDVAARTAANSRRASGAVGDIVQNGAAAVMVASGAAAEIAKQREEALKKQQQYTSSARELEKLAAEVEGGSSAFTKDLITPDDKSGSKGKTPAELAADARKKAYETDLKTIQYVSEMYNLTADKQIEKYDELKKRHAKFLAESVDDARSLNLQIKSLSADSAKDRYDASSAFIDAEVRKMENAGKSEREITNQRVYLWSKLRDKYGKDTEYYKTADEAVYQARKDLNAATAAEDEALYKSRKELADKYADDAKDMLDAELDAIKKAKTADLDAIEARKKAALDDYDARIDAIQKLRDANKQANEDADYAAELSAKKSRLTLLQSAVGPEGIAEREALLKEIAQMQTEHDRELADRSLEAQQDTLKDEKDAKEKAYDDEITRTEAQYDALTAALDSHATDVKAIESGVQAFRVAASANANTQILADLDTFVAQYTAKVSALSDAKKAADLAEYNANKDAYDKAKTSGDTAQMTQLAARNAALRQQYGITADTGQKLQSFADGGIIAGLRGAAVTVQAHAGEIVLNPQQQSALWQMITAPKAVSNAPSSPTYITQEIDMSVNDVTLADGLGVATLYDERARAAQRLQTMGVKSA